MKRNRVNTFLTLLFASALLISCVGGDDDDDDPGNWVRYSDFEGVTRTNAISFVIDNKAYVGLGRDGDDEYLQDMWRYDPDQNFWQQVDSFPGIGRVEAVAFSINGKGYVGTGYNQDLDTEELKDFWEYNPQTDEWTQKADLAGVERYLAVGFSIGDYGYIGTGYNGNYLKDFWKYDPSLDTWEQSVSLYGSKRESGVSFVINGIAYVGTGRNNGSYIQDFWAFNPEGQLWTNLTQYDEDDDYDDFIETINRYGAVAFVMDDIAYISTGISDSYSSSVYSYDPETNEWNTDITGFEGTARTGAVAFTLNGMGYITTGSNGSYLFDDLWGFDPVAEYDEYD